MDNGKLKETVWKGEHIEVEKLANGVFAALYKIGGAAVSNAGIIDLGDRTIVFDSLYLPSAAQELKAAAEELTTRGVSIVAKSHYHYDHVWGSQVFGPETPIVSSVHTRELIRSACPAMLDRQKSSVDASLEQAQNEYDSAKNDQDKTQALVWLGQYKAFKKEHENLRIRIPDTSFTDTLELHGSRRSVKIISFPQGHSEDDCVLVIPEEGIVFMGDLLFIGFHPYLPSGNSEKLNEAISQVQALNPTLVVPGHGRVGNNDDLVQMKQYVESVQEFVSELVERGVPKEQLSGQPVVSPYENWLYRKFYYGSLNFFYDKLVG